jgi:hypothetical protein
MVCESKLLPCQASASLRKKGATLATQELDGEMPGALYLHVVGLERQQAE